MIDEWIIKNDNKEKSTNQSNIKYLVEKFTGNDLDPFKRNFITSWIIINYDIVCSIIFTEKKTEYIMCIIQRYGHIEWIQL